MSGHSSPLDFARPGAALRSGRAGEDGAPLLSIQSLSVELGPRHARVRAVRDVSFDVGAGDVVGVVGESGSGKTLTALAALRLLEPGQVARGQVLFRGRDLLALPEREVRALRGAAIGLVFQDTGASLDPSWRVGDLVGEPLRIHRGLSRAAARAAAVELLRKVGVGDPEGRARAFPHELSGGLRQRALLAAAIACGPELLVADEPTSALDATVAAQVMDLLVALQRESGMGVMLVSHDLGLVAERCHRVVVLYAGEVVEAGPAAALLSAPRHPYTAALVAVARGGEPRARLPELPGAVPRPDEVDPGACAFAPRCPRAAARCRREPPRLGPAADRADAAVRCFFPHLRGGSPGAARGD